jgi:hypothetical protein
VPEKYLQGGPRAHSTPPPNSLSIVILQSPDPAVELALLKTGNNHFSERKNFTDVFNLLGYSATLLQLLTFKYREDKW